MGTVHPILLDVVRDEAISAGMNIDWPASQGDGVINRSVLDNVLPGKYILTDNAACFPGAELRPSCDEPAEFKAFYVLLPEVDDLLNLLSALNLAIGERMNIGRIDELPGRIDPDLILVQARSPRSPEVGQLA